MKGSEKMSDISWEFNAGEFYQNIEHIPRNIYRTRGDAVYQIYRELYKNDYKRYIPVASKDLLKQGFSVYKSFYRKLFIFHSWNLS